jgi:hypothetical protein
MKSGERDDSEGASTGRNFVARDFGVKPHGAILGMQMQCNRVAIHMSRHSGAARSGEPGISRFPDVQLHI